MIPKKNKLVALIAVLLVSLFYIFYMGKSKGATSAKLSDKFEKIEFSEEYNQDEIKKVSKEVITLISKGEYKELSEISEDELKVLLTSKDEKVKKEYEKIDKILKKKGKLEEINIGQIDCYRIKETKQEFALVNAKVKYEKGKIKYLLYMNKNNELMAFKVN